MYQNPTQTKAWQDLLSIEKQGGRDSKSSPKVITHRDLDLALDLSRALMSEAAWNGLCDLAQEQQVEDWRDKMVAGAAMNLTENRAVGHVWLRDEMHSDVQNVLRAMRQFVQKTHDGNHFTDLVHIGIGGSDLGPRMVCDALCHLSQIITPHFVSNVDAADIETTLKQLNPDTTLFIIASKTFTTQETMMNATYAKDWLGDRDIAQHMIALSTNTAAVTDFGIHPDHIFPFWDWVGGRFSVWSSIGMPIALAYGFDVFDDFLQGGKVMDNHFKTAPLTENLPILLALFGIWNRNFKNRPAVAVLPYAQNLSLFSNFLQQLDMESNGKSVDRNGDFITDYTTGPIIFGQVGTNGQHAFHQWLHQGTDIIPCEFITCAETPYDQEHQRVLNAHAAAQVQAFAEGFESMDNKHKHYAGGRPSITLTLNRLTPQSLGQLIALYEHKIFTQGVIWNINSFDQFGVELGKKIAKNNLLK